MTARSSFPQTDFGSQQRLEQATATGTAPSPPPRPPRPAGLGPRCARRRKGQSRCAQGAEGRGRASASRARRRARDGRTQSLVTRVLAPFDRTIGNKAAEVGELVQPGARLMALVPLNASYVDANFKETQLAMVKPGQEVCTRSTPRLQVIEGVVSSISTASGGQFSLLPPDNATGNFTRSSSVRSARHLPEGGAERGFALAGALGRRNRAYPRSRAAEPTGSGRLGSKPSPLVAAAWHHGRPSGAGASLTTEVGRPSRRLQRQIARRGGSPGLSSWWTGVDGDPGHPDRFGFAIGDPAGFVASSARSLPSRPALWSRKWSSIAALPGFRRGWS